MSEGLRVGEIVDCDEFDVGIVERGAHYVAPDTSKTVNAYFDSHLALREDHEDITEKECRAGNRKC